MRLRTLALGIGCIVSVGACSTGSGQPAGLPSGGPGADSILGRGFDRGSGTDPGGGVTPAIGSGGSSSGPPVAPSTCNGNSPCPSGQICSTTSKSRLGFCLTPCSVPAGMTVSEGCGSAMKCVRLSDSKDAGATMGACFKTCTSAADCPAIAGLVAACIPRDSKDTASVMFCVWDEVAEPDPPPVVPDTGVRFDAAL